MKLSQIGSRILVENFQESFKFYTEVLGYKVFWGNESGHFAAFTTEEIDEPCLSIFLKRNMSMYKGVSIEHSNEKNDKVAFIIPTDDVDKDYEILRKKGVVFLGEPQTIKEWFMRCVYFRDNEGNLIEMTQEI